MEVSPVHIIRSGAQEYKLTPPTIETEAGFRRFLEARAIDGVRRNKAAWGDDYTEVISRAIKDIGLGRFAWGKGDLWAESLDYDESWCELAFLTVAQSHPELSRPAFQKIWTAPGGKVSDRDGAENDASLGAEMIQVITRFLNRPNSPSPVATAPGTP